MYPIYFPILDTYEAINLLKWHLFINLQFLRCCLTSLRFISVFLVCIIFGFNGHFSLNKCKRVSLEMC